MIWASNGEPVSRRHFCRFGYFRVRSDAGFCPQWRDRMLQAEKDKACRLLAAGMLPMKVGRRVASVIG
jgi:hypothetical protein